MSGAVITGAFVMTPTGAYYLLESKFEEYGSVFLRVGVPSGVVFWNLERRRRDPRLRFS